MDSRRNGRSTFQLNVWLVLAAVLASVPAWSQQATVDTPSGQTTRSPAAPQDGSTLDPDSVDPLTARLREDLFDLMTAPGRMSRRDWQRVALLLGVVAGSVALDDEIQSIVRRPDDPEIDAFARAIRPLGQEGGLGLIGGLWIAGNATGNETLHAMGRDGAEAVVLSAGIITPLLKEAFGRSRPRRGHGSRELLGPGDAFPSGEATQVFAIASVIAAHSDRWWVDWLSWSAAVIVSWQRMRLDAHWSSDVIGGAIIGASVGRWVVRRNRQTEGPRWDVTPLAGEGGYGLAARFRF